MGSFFLEKLGSDGDCIATFSMAVIKHTAKRNLQKEEVTGAYGSRRIRVHHGRNHSNKQSKKLDQKHKAERAHGSR